MEIPQQQIFSFKYKLKVDDERNSIPTSCYFIQYCFLKHTLFRYMINILNININIIFGSIYTRNQLHAVSRTQQGKQKEFSTRRYEIFSFPSSGNETKRGGDIQHAMSSNLAENRKRKCLNGNWETSVIMVCSPLIKASFAKIFLPSTGNLQPSSTNIPLHLDGSNNNKDMELYLFKNV